MVILSSRTVWDLLAEHAPRGKWLSLTELYGIVESRAHLDDADRAGVTGGSRSPKWKRTVRNALQRRKGRDELDWDGKGSFRFR